MTVTAVGAMSALRATGDDAATGAGAPRAVRRSGLTIAADGSYAACLAESVTPDGTGRGLLVERWTLAGPEPYAVPLPGRQPEEPGTQALPLADGRVLVRRRVADRWDLALLYPSGPETGELPAGSLTGDDVRLLPPVPASPPVAYALAYDAAAGRTGVWRVHGTDGRGPEPVMTVEGRCTGGVWLDRAGRLLALDRELGGRTKAVAADLGTGRTSPLLQLTDDSDDRLLLAEPDSGLLVLRSDAAGETRLGWGVLGSRHPVRFPDALRVPGVQLTPVAAQPGQILAPEASVVALRAEVPGGAQSLALWRPGERRLHWRASPLGWLGAGLWLPRDELKLPYAVGESAPGGASAATAGAPGAAGGAGAGVCGLAAYEPPVRWGVVASAWEAGPGPSAGDGTEGPAGVTGVTGGEAGRGGAARRAWGPGGAAGAAATGEGAAGAARGASGAARPGGAAGSGPAGTSPAGGAARAATPCASAGHRGTRAFAGCAGGRVLLPAGGRGGGGRAVEPPSPAGEWGRPLPVRRTWAVLPLQQAPLAAVRAS
ncbi:hypothetical protein [Streptomyces sp. NPDC020983]|uniref:hypothetical protein n=1 Tax=Streptomyces sp. NPDC020983 TaxID=3365106 RepID=UPI0037B35B76